MRRGTRVGQAYVAITADGDGINEEIVHSVEESEPGVEESGDRAGRGWRDRFADSAFGKKLDEIRDRAADRLRVSVGDAGDDAGKDFTHNFGDGIDDDFLGRVGEHLGENFASHLLNSLENRLAGGGDGGPLASLFDRLMSDAESKVSGNLGGGGKDNRLVGRSYRNNFINAISHSLRGIIDLSESAASGLAGVFKTIISGSSGGEEGVSLLSKLGSGLSELIAAGPGAVVALGAVALGMTLVVSVANALLAIVVALAATITSALVGALAVGSAALAAVAVAGGLTVLAFKSLTDSQKTLLKDAFRPLHQEAVGLGQTMLTNLIPAFDQWSRNLQVALALVQPLAAVMGGALAHAGDVLTRALSGPGIQVFLAVLSTELPGIITSLTVAFGGFLNGTLAIFAALLPMTEEFADHLGLVSRHFQSWATSAQGQNAIVDFVSRALVALNSLWNFVKAVGGLLVEVLFSPSGQQAGNNIFDSMTRAVKKFTAYLAEDDRLKHWFAEGVTFAEALGKAIKTIIKFLQALNQSGVIDGISRLVDIGSSAVDWFSQLPRVLQDLINPLQGFSDLIGSIASALSALGIGGGAPDIGAGPSTNYGGLLDPLGTAGTEPLVTSPLPTTTSTGANINDIIAQLQNSGAQAIANTSTGGATAGNLSAAQMAAYQALADSIIKNGPTFAALIQKALDSTHKTIQNAITTSNKNFANALRSAASSTDASSVTAALQSLVETQKATIQNTVETLRTNAKNMVTTAQDAVNSAAESLANATTQTQANSALAALAIAQKQLAQAEAAQGKINKQTKHLQALVAAADKIISGQGVLTQNKADALASGLKVVNATLADYADARAQVAKKLEAANQKLQEAITLRDNFKNAVTDAVNAFAALTTAQAQTINGVVQALTASDITTNLQTKLDQIKKFQSNLHILLSQGLSQAAYKQLVEAGVEQGGAYAEALVQGGQGAVEQVNSLTSQINALAESLGTEASNRMYQAGVDAAQGLVDGLTTLSAQLQAAATNLGNLIAAAIRKALGIHSPSTVMFDAMYDGVGDGVVDGLNASHRKVGAAASRLSAKVAISPSLAAAYSEGRVPTAIDNRGVSGNNDDPRFRDLIVQTPSEDPLTVAREVLNEVVGRLP